MHQYVFHFPSTSSRGRWWRHVFIRVPTCPLVHLVNLCLPPETPDGMTLSPDKDQYRVGESVGLSCIEANMVPQPGGSYRCSTGLTWEPPLPAELRCTDGDVDMMRNQLSSMSHSQCVVTCMNKVVSRPPVCRATVCPRRSMWTGTETTGQSMCLRPTGELHVRLQLITLFTLSFHFV